MGNANPGDRLSRDRAAGPRTVAIETGQASIPLTTLKTGVDFDLLLEYGLRSESAFAGWSFCLISARVIRGKQFAKRRFQGLALGPAG